MKIITLMAGITFLVFHFAFIFFYALPVYTKNKITFFSQTYVYPFFHQNWNLFAPVPGSNFKLFVEYKKDGKTVKKDLFNELLIKHQSNRFAGYEPLVLAFSNSIHYFEKNTILNSDLSGPVTDDAYFRVIEHETEKYLLTTEKIRDQKIRIFLLVEDIHSKKKRIYFN